MLRLTLMPLSSVSAPEETQRTRSNSATQGKSHSKRAIHNYDNFGSYDTVEAPTEKTQKT